MQSSEKKVWFIDANIIAYWVLGKGDVLKSLVSKFQLTNEFFEIYSRRYDNSIKLIEEIIKPGQEKTAEFFSSHLAINELFSGLKDELRSILLFNDGIPISRWGNPRYNPDIKPEDYEAIYKLTMKSFDSLFENSAIEYIPEQSWVDSSKYFDIYSTILFLIKDAKPMDSTLLATAILNKANFFVTEDKRLIDSAKKFIQYNYDLELIDPIQATQKLKKRSATHE